MRTAFTIGKWVSVVLVLLALPIAVIACTLAILTPDFPLSAAAAAVAGALSSLFSLMTAIYGERICVERR